MQLSPKVLRGLNIKGWKTYEPRVLEEKAPAVEAANEEELEAQLPPPPTREEIEQEREQILAAARKEGERLRKEALAKAEKEGAALREKAEKKGYAEGFAKGEQEAEQLKKEATRTLETAQAEHRALLDGAEGEIMQLAVSIAEKLLNEQLEINEDTVLAMIIRCLEALPGGREVFLRVSPQDEPLCRRKTQVLQALLRQDVSLQIVADDKVQPGSCIVESEEAEVTFYLQKEFEILTKKLLAMADKS